MQFGCILCKVSILTYMVLEMYVYSFNLYMYVVSVWKRVKLCVSKKMLLLQYWLYCILKLLFLLPLYIREIMKYKKDMKYNFQLTNQQEIEGSWWMWLCEKSFNKDIQVNKTQLEKSGANIRTCSRVCKIYSLIVKLCEISCSTCNNICRYVCVYTLWYSLI